MDQISLEEQQ